MPPKSRSKPSGQTRSSDNHLDPDKVVQTIISSMSDGLMVINHAGEIVYTNPALSDILELTSEQMLGKGWGELFFADPANHDFNQVIVEVITERIPHYNRQVGYRGPGGTAKELIVTTTLLPGNRPGDPLGGVLVMFKDVSELALINRRSQELLSQTRRLYQEKLEGLDRLARAVAHEIRNPVTTIGGLAARLLADKDPASRDAHYLQRILAGTGRLERVVEEVRAYADLPAPVRRLMEVKTWMRSVLKPYRSLAREAGLRLSLHGASHEVAPIEAEFDPVLLGRVLDILLRNALEATPPGGSIKVGLSDGEAGLVITVSDTGKGLDPADLPYVFDPLFTTKTDAVGMSLAIAKRIAQDHQGDLSVVSNGQGATFTLSLPRNGAPPQTGTLTPSRPPEMK